MSPITFRRTPSERDARLPPGQYDTGSSYPVLTAEVSPRIKPEDWTFRVDGLVDTPTTWSWSEAHALPPSTYDGDIHCVTTWSKFDTTFSGVSVDTFLEQAGVQGNATHAVMWSSTGYTSNLPLEHLTGGKAWVVWDFDGKPLPTPHGGPVRLLVPHLYFWKSVKWISGLRLLDHDEPGFWEARGYHNLGDPWREQRYTDDD